MEHDILASHTLIELYAAGHTSVVVDKLRILLHFSLRKYAKEVLLPFVIVVATSFVIPLIPYYLMQCGWLRFILVLCLSVATSSISLYFLGLNKKEKDLINSIISKFIRKKLLRL